MLQIAYAVLATKDRRQPTRKDSDLYRLVHEVDTVDQGREDGASFGRIEIRPALGEASRAGDDVGAILHVSDERLDRAEHVRLASQEPRQALLDEAFEVASRDPAPARRLPPGASDQPRRDVIAVTGALLVGIP